MNGRECVTSETPELAGQGSLVRHPLTWILLAYMALRNDTGSEVCQGLCYTGQPGPCAFSLAFGVGLLPTGIGISLCT